MAVLGGVAVSYGRGSLLSETRPKCRSASEREGSNLNGFKDFRTENGSSQVHELPQTVVFDVRWFDRGADVCGGSSL